MNRDTLQAMKYISFKILFAAMLFTLDESVKMRHPRYGEKCAEHCFVNCFLLCR